MTAQRIDLKNPILAAVLAWLVPGAGHAYQGRWFKAILYSACIWSTWGCGWVLGDGRAVYYSMDAKRGRKTIGFAAQAGVGVAALPAILQARRAGQQQDRSEIDLLVPLRGKFDGALVGVNFTDGRRAYFQVQGQMEIQPSEDQTLRRAVTGQLTGTVSSADEFNADVPNGAPVELRVEYLDKLEPEIFPSPHRAIKCRVRGQITGEKGGDFSADLSGKVLNVRGLLDRYAAPLDADGLEAANGELGKYWEIALAYTWIAGLLNLLAIRDAFEGPAYGFGDEQPVAEKAPAGPAPAPSVPSVVPVVAQASPPPVPPVVSDPNPPPAAG